MAHVNRKEYLFIFGMLAVLTVLEIAVVYVPIGKVAIGTALVGLALAKAALVGLFFMHLKFETPVLKATVAIPLTVPGLYAIFLIIESHWRFWQGGGLQAIEYALR